MPRSLTRSLTILALLATGAAGAASDPRCYTGYAYHDGNDELAFSARYTATGTPGEPLYKWDVTYRDPAGDVLATKTLNFSHSRFVPVYTQNFRQSGNMAGIQRDAEGNWRMVNRKGASGELETEAFELQQPMAGDNGIHPFIQSRFDTLMAGDAVKFQMLLPPRQRMVDMRMQRIDDTTVDGNPAVRFRAKVDMLFVNWFTQELTFSYNPENQRLISYQGVSNMQDQRGKPYPVRIDYYYGEPPASLPELAPCSAGLAAAVDK